ncbi:MAG: ATP synthase F1 subunit gamma, partial [Pseudomonadota bacterium]
MATSRDIRTKISGIKNIQKITRAMQMVAASKMKKTKDRMFASRPYAEKIHQVITHLGRTNPEYRHPFMQVRTAKRVGYIVMTTDRGLCGALNLNIFKKMLIELKQLKAQNLEADLCLVGDKADSFFRSIGGSVVAKANHIDNDTGVKDLIGAVKTMSDLFVKGKVDSVYVCYSKFINTMVQKPDVIQLLPVTVSHTEKREYIWDYLYEPNPQELLDGLLRRHLEAQVYQSVVETLACEQSARMISMKNATENAA